MKTREIRIFRGNGGEMILIFGGAFQGKKEYVINKYKVREDQIIDCKNPVNYRDSEDVPGGSNCAAVDHLEAWILRLIEEKKQNEQGSAEMRDPVSVLRQALASGVWKNTAIICTDITRGVVPADAVLRTWRDQTGRCLQLLAESADEVVQVFCGLGRRLK